MTLTSHILIATALGSLVPVDPISGLLLGAASHYLLDVVPHWDYRLESEKEEGEMKWIDMTITPAWRRDIFRVGLDAGLGLAAAGLLFWTPTRLSGLTFLSIAGGTVLPDLLQAAYFKWGGEILASIHRFDRLMHTKNKIVSAKIGVPFQAAIVLVFIVLALLH